MSKQQPQLRVIQGAIPSSAGRQPPKDEDVEAAIIGTILERPDVFDRVVMILTPEIFYPAHHQTIFQAMIDLAANGVPPGLIELTGFLRDRQKLQAIGGPGYLVDCTYRPVVAHIEREAKRIRDLWRLRKAKDLSLVIHSACYDPVENPQEFLEAYEKQVSDIATLPEQTHTISIRDATVEVFEKIKAIADKGGGISGITSGMRQYDDLTGGHHKCEQTILAARPGMGKTAAAMAWALNAADVIEDKKRRNGVLFFSLEMPREQLAMRTICGQARINNNDLRTGKLIGYQDPWGALTEAASWIGSLPIAIHDQQNISPLELRAIARRQQALWKNQGIELALIIVDYLQLMRARALIAPNASREQEVAECSRLTKAVANELNVPLIALAALKRDVDKQKEKRPVLADLRESGAIEANADTVVFLHREAYYLKDKCPAETRRDAEFIIEKQRNGPQGTAHTKFYGPYTLFSDDDNGWAPEDNGRRYDD